MTLLLPDPLGPMMVVKGLGVSSSEAQRGGVGALWGEGTRGAEEGRAGLQQGKEGKAGKQEGRARGQACSRH